MDSPVITEFYFFEKKGDLSTTWSRSWTWNKPPATSNNNCVANSCQAIKRKGHGSSRNRNVVEVRKPMAGSWLCTGGRLCGDPYRPTRKADLVQLRHWLLNLERNFWEIYKSSCARCIFTLPAAWTSPKIAEKSCHMDIKTNLAESRLKTTWPKHVNPKSAITGWGRRPISGVHL